MTIHIHSNKNVIFWFLTNRYGTRMWRHWLVTVDKINIGEMVIYICIIIDYFSYLFFEDVEVDVELLMVAGRCFCDRVLDTYVPRL